MSATATISCAELDRLAHLPPEPLPTNLDACDVLLIQARRTQIHLEMRMELMAEEESAAASSAPGPRAPART